MSWASDFMEDELTECIEEIQSLKRDSKKYDNPYNMAVSESNEIIDRCIEIIKKHRGY